MENSWQNRNIKFASKLPLRRHGPDERPALQRGHAMDVSAIASVATEMSQNQTAQAVQIAVLKKAMEIEEQSALQLLQALPNNPPNLGNKVDVFA